MKILQVAFLLLFNFLITLTAIIIKQANIGYKPLEPFKNKTHLMTPISQYK